MADQNQKTTVKFDGLTMTKAAINALELQEIKEQKASYYNAGASKNMGYLLTWGGGAMALGAIGWTIFEKASNNNNISTGALALFFFGLNFIQAGMTGITHRKRADELDVIQYIKTGDHGGVANGQKTYEIAAKSGYEIG